MKHEEHFDELGRRKLAEREFMFDEGHWQGVQAALDAQRKRRPAAWIWAAALLLIGGGALWYATKEESRVAGTSTAVDASQERSTTVSDAEQAPAHVKVESAEPVSAPTKTIGDAAERQSSAPDLVAEKKENAERSSREAPPASSAERAQRPLQELPPVVPSGTSTMDVPFVAQQAAPSKPGTSSAENQEQELVTEAARIEGTTTTGEKPVEVGDEAPRMVPVQDTTPAGTAQAEATMDPAARAPASNPPLADSTRLLSVLPSPDSAATPTPFQPPSKAPWPLQATLWAGPSWTNNRYNGGNSTEWINGVSGEQAWDVGGEVMVMRRNFGFGIGAHYATYTERFSQDEVLRQQLEWRNSYFFNTIDTTVTIVIDTVMQGGTVHYETQQVDTSFLVLDWTTDTTVTTIRERDAQETRNTASYLEIPLLLDAHLTQGRWNLGLRGGPTLGLLTGQRGPLPGSNNEAPVPFTEMVFGYTARAYIRYGLTTAWSVGLEPGLRGHFGNALGSGAVVRSNRAMGVMLGLTYRFR